MLRTRRRNKITRPGGRPHAQTVGGLNAETRGGIEPMGKIFLLTFLFIGQLDVLRLLRQQVRRDLLLESKKHQAWRLLGLIPGIGPIRAALLIALIQTPHRFRTKRQLWTYSGLGLETHDSAQYRVVEGQLQRSKKPVTLRGLNQDHNHDLKDIFKGAATRASSSRGPFHDFCEHLLAQGRKPTMARLTLARKIAAITWIVWKKEVRFDASYLKSQAA